MSRTHWYFIVGVLAGMAFSYYAVTAPYERFPGVVIGGEPTPPPTDWTPSTTTTWC